MAQHDLIVAGAGISGLALAWRAARDGRRVLLLERAARVGGCIRSEKTADNFWFELGAHTVYNSYSGFIDLLTASELTPQVLPRGKARAKFGFLLPDGSFRWLTPPKVLMQLSWRELLLYAPRGIFRSKKHRTLQEHFSALVGPENYRRVLGPFLSAVPSQRADGFPAEGAGSLFKKRARREDFLRSFGLAGGLQTLCEAIAKRENIDIEFTAEVRSIGKDGDHFFIDLADGRRLTSKLAALAAPLGQAKSITREYFPKLAAALDPIATASIDSVGVVLPIEKAWLPACAFVVPAEDSFFSCVTRDPFPDEKYRAFAFHFRPGLSRSERTARICSLLRVEEKELLDVAETSVSLPSPGREHAAQVAAVELALKETGLMLTGNYFAGLAIEDCIQRSFSEWARSAQ